MEDRVQGLGPERLKKPERLRRQRQDRDMGQELKKTLKKDEKRT
jgi:hypothetical protein